MEFIVPEDIVDTNRNTDIESVRSEEGDDSDNRDMDVESRV